MHTLYSVQLSSYTFNLEHRAFVSFFKHRGRISIASADGGDFKYQDPRKRDTLLNSMRFHL